MPREDYERLALDCSAVRAGALQDEDLFGRALEALDLIAAAREGVPDGLRGVAWQGVEMRALLARSHAEDGAAP